MPTGWLAGVVDDAGQRHAPPPVRGAEEVGDRVRYQLRAHGGHRVEGVVGVGEFGVGNGCGTRVAQRGDEGLCLRVRDNGVVAAVQDEERRSVAVDVRNRRRG